MATMNVSLPDAMKDWVDARLADGSFGNASEYVRHLIRRDQERAAALAALQAAVDEGVASGAPRAFDLGALKARMRAGRDGG